MKNILSFILITVSSLSPAHGYEFDRTFNLGNTIPSECIEIRFPKTQFIGIISTKGIADWNYSPRIIAAELDERLLVSLPAEAKSVISNSIRKSGKFCPFTYGTPISAQLLEALFASNNISLYQTDDNSFVSTVNVRRIWSGSTIEYIIAVPKESGTIPLLINLNIISHAR